MLFVNQHLKKSNKIVAIFLIISFDNLKIYEIEKYK